MKTITERAADQLKNVLRQDNQHQTGVVNTILKTDGLEIQANVKKGAGEEKETSGPNTIFTDGIDTWANRRVDAPQKNYRLNDKTLENLEAFGFTGWNYETKSSHWIGLDYDDLTQHSATVGISDEQLAEVREAAKKLPYVEVRCSSSGGEGLHLYVRLDNIPCESREAHASLAKPVVAKMSKDVGFDFSKGLDCIGAVLWIWRDDMVDSSFEVLSPATTKLSIDDLEITLQD